MEKANSTVINLIMEDDILYKIIKNDDGTISKELFEDKSAGKENFTDKFTDFVPHPASDNITRVLHKKYPVDLTGFTEEQLKFHVERSLKLEALLIRFCGGDVKHLLKESKKIDLSKHTMAREMLWLLCEVSGGDWAYYKNFVK
jgi:hypothetical protein